MMRTPPTRGRPRSADIDDRVLAATRDILATEGYAGVSMGGIADALGVGRQSLYRRWPRKPLLVFDALWGPAQQMASDLPDAGSVRADLGQLFAAVARSYATERQRDTARHLIADALKQPDILDELRRRFIWPRLAVVEAIVARARARGEIGDGPSAIAVAEGVLGATLGHFLIIGPRNGRFLDELTELVLRGLGASSADR